MTRTIVSCGILFLFFALFAPAQEPKKKPAPAKESDWVTNDEAGVKVLIGYLKHKDECAVCVGLDALARMGDKSKVAIPAIRATLLHESWWVRIEGARTLIDLNVETELAHKTLSDALTVKDGEIRIRLANLLGEMVNPPFDWPVQFSCWGPGPRPRRATHPDFRQPAMKFLMIAMEDKEPKIRYYAAASLGRFGSDANAAVPLLLKALEDKEPDVRQVAAEAAKRIVIDAGAKAGVKEFEKANLDYLLK